MPGWSSASSWFGGAFFSFALLPGNRRRTTKVKNTCPVGSREGESQRKNERPVALHETVHGDAARFTRQIQNGQTFPFTWATIEMPTSKCGLDRSPIDLMDRRSSPPASDLAASVSFNRGCRGHGFESEPDFVDQNRDRETHEGKAY